MSSDNRLAEVLNWVWDEPIPAAVDRKVREIALDTVGCVLAASGRPRLRALAATLAAAEPGPVRVAGFTESFSASCAAALFAAAACWDEACEGLARAHGRPGVPVIAACAALAQARPCNLREVLAAIAVGYETGGRAGAALRIGPGMHVDAAWPALGVAAAVVRLQGGTAAQALAAVRTAACQIPRSLYLPVKTGAEARCTYLPHASQLGMLCAHAAMAGLGAPEAVLDELGATAFAGPGEWWVLESYVKPFAAVRHVHYAAAAALALRPKLVDRLHEISRIQVSTYAEAMTYCGNRAPELAIQAQFSLSYGAARALVAGSLDPDAYTEQALRDPLVRAIEAKIELVEDGALTRTGGRGAHLRIDLHGERLEGGVTAVAGDPSLPMSRGDLVEKFSRYAGRPAGDGMRFLRSSGDASFRELYWQLAEAAPPIRP